MFPISHSVRLTFHLLVWGCPTQCVESAATAQRDDSAFYRRKPTLWKCIGYCRFIHRGNLPLRSRELINGFLLPAILRFSHLVPRPYFWWLVPYFVSVFSLHLSPYFSSHTLILSHSVFLYFLLPRGLKIVFVLLMFFATSTHFLTFFITCYGWLHRNIVRSFYEDGFHFSSIFPFFICFSGF